MGPSTGARVGVPRSVTRLRLAAVCLALTLLVFTQSSGLEAADTKLDLVVTPARFLHQALTMWDPTAAAGQLQDQAYGYLFPMGPFFLVAKWLGLAPWVVQRLWESVLVVGAFLGVVRLSRLLGVRGFYPRIAAGLAYALAPRMLAELGVISSELMPMVVLPWMLIPLVRGSVAGSPRRAAVLSGLAFLFAGGINASAALAVLAVPALWLLTRSRGPRRAALMRWWVAAIVSASLWWALPLVALGRYSPPFLNWIESSAVTTGVTDYLDVLRGTDHWQAFLGSGEWPGAWILVTAPAAVLATVGVASLGLWGLARRGTPHRMFLVLSVLFGVMLVTTGHVATIGPAFAGTMRHLLDGPFNAFRNIHKFDPVLRLPLAIGVGHALAAIGAKVPRRAVIITRGERIGVYPLAAVGAALAMVAAVALTPALTGRIVPQTRTSNDPVWWREAGSWLGAHDGSGRALVVPGAAQPGYVWGQPRDDALQPVANGAWTVRDAAPLTQPGYIRLLDGIESILAAGSSSAVLAPLLARAGIRYVVVRNDLDTTESGATPLAYVHATMSGSPGWSQAASFGPSQLPQVASNRLTDLGLGSSASAVQVYENERWSGAQAELLPAAGTVTANGSSERLAALVAAGLGPDTATVFGADAGTLTRAGLSTDQVLTDGIEKREFGFGAVDRYSAIMTMRQAYQQKRSVHDYLPANHGPLSTMDYRGISSVTASSAGSDVGPLYSSAADSPWAVLDSDPSTSWVSASLSGGVGQWLEVDFASALNLSTLTLAFPAGRSGYPTRLRIGTDVGSVERSVYPGTGEQKVEVPAGFSRSLRITVLAMTPGVSQAAISTLTMPGLTVSRTLLVPGMWDPDLVDFQIADGYRSSCLTVEQAAACDPSWAAAGEEDGLLDRSFSLSGGDSYQLRGQLRIRAGAALDALLDFGNSLRAIASSDDSADPRERAGAAVDADLSTGWVAKAGDRQPTLQISLLKAARLTGLSVVPLTSAPVTRPTRVLVHAGSEVFAADVPASGLIDFPHPVMSTTVRVSVLASTLRVSTDSVTGLARQLPVGIAEIELHGVDVPHAQLPSTLTLSCAAGLTVTVDGHQVPVSVSAPASTVLAGQPVDYRGCSAVQLNTGSNRVTFRQSARVSPVSVVLERSGDALPDQSPPAGTMQIGRWGSTSRTVQVHTSAAALLVVHENANAGWRASYRGKSLTSVMIDGWEQGWIVPRDVDGQVTLTFEPQRPVDIGLLLGLLSALMLVLVALVPCLFGKTSAASVVDARPQRLLLVIGAGILYAVLGGWFGLVVYALVLALRRFGGSILRRVQFGWPAALMLAGLGVALATAPFGSAHSIDGSAALQLGALLVLALFGVAGLEAATPAPSESP